MRTRDKRIVFYLTGEECQALNYKVQMSGLRREAYIRKVLSEQKIVEFDIDSIQPAIIQLRKTGNALHEMLRTAQLSEVVDPIELREAIKDNRAAEKKIADAFTKLWP